MGSGELAPSAPPRARTARVQDSVTPDPGTRAEFPLPRQWAGKSVRVSPLSPAFGGQDPVRLGPGAGRRPELGRSRRAGPGTPVGAAVRKKPPSPALLPGNAVDSPCICVCGLRICLGNDSALCPEFRAGKAGRPGDPISCS